ncbi:hypothetical protein [Robertmurraya sp. FSL R5-0851]|uniref:hypothetical protein n=1 Tax=Robertmurraya sp. FSL R5-0851 TaxID=2921584 RepID=UPI0030F4CB95
METKHLSGLIKEIIQSVEGCYTTTTEKKKWGFTTKNKWDIKWGQVDVTENKIRIVLDTIPGKYSEEAILELTEIPVKSKGSRSTGFFIKKTEKSIPHYDAIEISIYEKDLANIYSNKLLDFIKTTSEESGFKTKAPM